MDIYTALLDFEATLQPKLLLYVDYIIFYVQLMAAVIMSVYVGVRVVKSFMSGGEKLDPSTLTRPCLTLAALFLYTYLIEYVAELPVGYLNEIVQEGAIATKAYSKGEDLSGMIAKMTYTQEIGGPDGGGIYDIIQITPNLELLHFGIFFLASVAGGYVLFRQLIIKSIYLIIGPFALALSLIEGNEGVLAKWYQGYLSVLLWLPILTVVQTIILVLPIETTVFDVSDIIFSIAFQVVLIFTVFKVPKYANTLVAQGSSMGGDLGQTFKNKLGGKMMSKLG